MFFRKVSRVLPFAIFDELKKNILLIMLIFKNAVQRVNKNRLPVERKL